MPAKTKTSSLTLGLRLKETMKTEKATFGMGCFWSPQLLFDKTPGVIKTVVGFMDGNKKRFPNPTYQQVCDNPTGYAEVTQITFNPKKILRVDIGTVVGTHLGPGGLCIIFYEE